VLERLPIRWKLAVLSAGLTFVILCAFAVVVGELTQRRIRSDFTEQVTNTADRLAREVSVDYNPKTGRFQLSVDRTVFEVFKGADNAAVRVVDASGHQLTTTPSPGPKLDGAPETGSQVVQGYRMETRRIIVRPFGVAFLQYGRPFSDSDATVRRVRLFLLFGVLGGTGFALLGGVLLARRAMSPVSELTAAAAEIRRTRDPGLAITIPPVEDEVGHLARTLDGMLQALDEAQSETEGALARQREFVADASHELRTPLTSVLANLELLAETLEGDQREAAESALRSSQRMRRLVADLLLLARADARREAPREPLDLAAVVVDAAAEAGVLAEGRSLDVDAEPVWVEGSRDELHRVVLNLLENALRHTPPGTRVRVSAGYEDGQAVVVVADDGPGIPPDQRERIFDRFVRGAGDAAGSFGLGLSIVRAVAEQHGGSVRVEDAEPGARFVVRLPALGPELTPPRRPAAPSAAA
jgi:two-component system OmpR family sensor kinase